MSTTKETTQKNFIPNYGRGSDWFCSHLTKDKPIGDWKYVSVHPASLQISFPAKLSDGSSAVLNGTIKMQSLFGNDITREYAICDIVGNSTTLSEVFYFNSSHIGKSGIVCDVPSCGFVRFVLEPSGNDDVLIEFTI